MESPVFQMQSRLTGDLREVAVPKGLPPVSLFGRYSFRPKAKPKSDVDSQLPPKASPTHADPPGRQVRHKCKANLIEAHGPESKASQHCQVGPPPKKSGRHQVAQRKDAPVTQVVHKASKQLAMSVAETEESKAAALEAYERDKTASSGRGRHESIWNVVSIS